MPKRKNLPDRKPDGLIASPILSDAQFEDLEEVLETDLDDENRQWLEIVALLYLNNRYRDGLGHSPSEQQYLLKVIAKTLDDLLGSLTQLNDAWQRLGNQELRTIRVLLKSRYDTHPLETIRKMEQITHSQEDIRNLSHAVQDAAAFNKTKFLAGLTEQRRQKIAADWAISNLIPVYETTTRHIPKAYHATRSGEYDTSFVRFVRAFLLAVDSTNEKWFTRSPTALGKRVQEQLAKRRKESD